ncbi:Disease resistance protein L6 [Linum perenne]
MDDEKLRKGEGIWPNFVEAIGQSKISIPIFSPRYAESKWCLKELAEIIEHKKREEGHIILPIFYMVDPRDVRNQTGRYEEAFKQHKRNNNFDEKTIETWKAALTQIEDMLDLGSQGVNLVGLHGMGGIGKTTLATAVYNKVSAYFDREAKKIILERITRFKILVVLDDVDEKFKFEEVLGDPESFASGSRFIATSRDKKVMGSLSKGQSKLYEVQGMNPIRSLQLFCKHAFKKDSPQSGFEALSNAIISTAGGLPLTLKEAHKLKVLILGNCSMMSKLPEFPESGSLEILEIQGFRNREEDLKIEKLRNLKVLRLENCGIGKIRGGTIGKVMKELRELNLFGISCDYNTFRQTIVDIEELSLLQILNVQSYYLKNVLEGIKLPKSLKKLHTSSGFANVEELLELEEFTIWYGTELVIPPAAGSTMLPSSLTNLTISYVDSKLIPNLKNLRNLTELQIQECPNLEEVQGMGGLKSLQVLRIDGAEKLTHIHGLGNLMSCSSCKLTELYIADCPLLRDVVTFEQQDDDDGSEGERERYVSVQIESLVRMKIKYSPSIDWRSIPRLSKFPMLQYLTVKNIGLNINEESASQQGQHQQLEGLVDLSISNVDSKRILNLKNLVNLTELKLSECPNLEEIHGMGGLKSLEVLRIVGMEKLTRIHGLGYLMSSSNSKLTELYISKCPLLREVVSFEKQDDDGGDGDDFLVRMEILEIPSVGGGPTPRLSKLPMVKYMKNNELTMVLKRTENTEDLSERKLLFSFLSKLNKRLSYLLLEDVPALQEEIVGAGDMKELCLIMNDFLSLERLHIKDLPYSSMCRIEFDLYTRKTVSFDFDLSSLTIEGGDLGKLRLEISWPHKKLPKDAESKGEADSAMEMDK